MAKKPFMLTEEQVVDAIAHFGDEADWDALAEVLGIMYGGECTTTPIISPEGVYMGESFSFMPNKKYGGAFGKVIEL